MSKKAAPVSIAPPMRLEVTIDDDGIARLLLVNGDRKYRLLVGDSGRVSGWPIQKPSPPPPVISRPRFECDRCDRFWCRPDQYVAIVNHYLRHHNLATDSAETADAVARARELLKCPEWQAELAWEARRSKLLREADGLRVDAIREEDLDRARKLRRRANELERKAQER